MSKFNDLRKRGISLLTAAFTVVSLSGCAKGEDIEVQKAPVATAIVMTNENALILDVSSYQYFNEYSKISDMYGNDMRIGNDNIILIDGENSNQQAKYFADHLVGWNGQVYVLEEYINIDMEDQSDSLATAIVMTNENALIVDVSSYQYFDGYSTISDMYGKDMRVGNDNIILIEGEYSQQMATFVAAGLISEYSEIRYYDELVNSSNKKTL